jgi:outer membrane protein
MQIGQTGTTRVENGQVVIVSRDPWSSSLGVSANVELFDGGGRFFDLSQARANRVAADVNTNTARWEATLAAKQAFFDVLAARETQVVAAAQLEQADRQRVVAVARTHAKAATRSDSLRAEIQVRSAQLGVLQAATARASADAALARAVGATEPVTAAPGDTTGPALSLDEAALAALVEDAPTVRGARANLEAARQAQKSVWSTYLPSVSASWSRSGNGSGGAPAWNPDELEYSGSWRLSLGFPIFNQFQRESQVTQAAVAVQNAEADLRDAQLAARQSLTDGLGAYRAAAQQEASQVATVDAAEEDLRVQSQRYAVGGSTLLDVLASQTQLDQARRDLIRARYDQRIAKAQLEALVGREL